MPTASSRISPQKIMGCRLRKGRRKRSFHTLAGTCASGQVQPDTGLDAALGVPAGPAIAASFAGQVSRPVLRAIGRAVRAQFDATETDMLRLELDNGGAVVVFSPEVRDTVTEAEGVTLLSE